MTCHTVWVIYIYIYYIVILLDGMYNIWGECSGVVKEGCGVSPALFNFFDPVAPGARPKLQPQLHSYFTLLGTF